MTMNTKRHVFWGRMGDYLIYTNKGGNYFMVVNDSSGENIADNMVFMTVEQCKSFISQIRGILTPFGLKEIAKKVQLETI
jgi:hypothetical protein